MTLNHTSTCRDALLMQARLEAEQREAERRREEVLEAELQTQQAAAALTDRLHEAERDAAAAAAEFQVPHREPNRPHIVRCHDSTALAPRGTLNGCPPWP